MVVGTEGQVQQANTKCRPGECVIISRCPAFLTLVKQMKSGNHAAKAKVITNQCGFERYLPKVCCRGNVNDREKTKIPTKSPSFELKPAPVALVQTTKQASFKRRVTNAFIRKQNNVKIPSDCGLTNVISPRIVNGRHITLVSP